MYSNAPAIHIGYSRWGKWEYPIKMSEPSISENLFAQFLYWVLPFQKASFFGVPRIAFCYQRTAFAYVLLCDKVVSLIRLSGCPWWMQLPDSYYINKDTLGCPWAVLLLPPMLQIWGVRTASGTTGTTWGVLVKLLDMLVLCMTRTTGQPVCIHLLYSLTHHRRPRAPGTYINHKKRPAA